MDDTYIRVGIHPSTGITVQKTAGGQGVVDGGGGFAFHRLKGHVCVICLVPA